MTPQGERYLQRDSVSVVSPAPVTPRTSRAIWSVPESVPEGVPSKDARHLSRFVLKVDGRTLAPRSARVRGSTAEFYLFAVEGKVRVVRRRLLGGV